jgi:hypothetical protein
VPEEDTVEKTTFWIAIAAMGTLAPSALATSYNINVEAVNDYAPNRGPGDPNDLTHAVDNCLGFQDTIVGSDFLQGTRWSDGSVWDEDFRDRELSSTGGDDIVV